MAENMTNLKFSFVRIANSDPEKPVIYRLLFAVQYR